MKKIPTNTPPAARSAQTWTPPKLTRLVAGLAEAAVSGNLDITDHS